MLRKLTIIIAIGALAVAGCGPSAEDAAEEQKRMADSVASAEAAKRAAEEAAIAQDAIMDSLSRAADSTVVAADAAQ